MNFTVFMPMRTNRMKYVGIVLAADSTGRKLVYTFPIREDIMPSVERLTGKCLAQADEMGADLVVIQMNTYGGVVAAADSIRTMLLNSRIPVWVWIDNQAASAGALIALAADRIYIRPGGNIGAASVVDQQGRPMPDKYQSFMRATMRSTAEAHGKVVERVDGTDTVWRWRRDPAIAEAMVGTTAGDSTTVGVLTLTADEALARHYSEGKAVSVAEVLSNAGVVDYTLYEYNPTTLDRVLGWLMNPFAQGIFIMLIVGGIYFELQTPGVGFPLVAAVLGAVLYFSPLYLEGMVQNWEPILFVVGLLLIAVEIFVLPGFGIAGIAGIVAVVTGLAFAAIAARLFRRTVRRADRPAVSGRYRRFRRGIRRRALFRPPLFDGRFAVAQLDRADDRPDSRTGLCRPPVAAGRPGRPHRDGHRRSASVRKDRARRDLLRCGRRKRTFYRTGRKSAGRTRRERATLLQTGLFRPFGILKRSPLGRRKRIFCKKCDLSLIISWLLRKKTLDLQSL